MKSDELIEQGYSLFSSYRVSIPLDVCKVCCISDEEERILVKTPVKQLSKDILQTYIGSASCGSNKEQSEMCHFIPRILELIAKGEYPTISIETLFDRLYRFPLKDTEYDFLFKFFSEFWLKYINHYPDKDILPFLELWRRQKSQASIFHFVDLILDASFGKHRILNMFSTISLNDAINQWLIDDETRKHFIPLLEDIYFDESLDDMTVLRIEAAYNVYKHLE